MPGDVLLPKGIPHPHIHTAVELTFHVLRVNQHSGIAGGGHFKDSHFTVFSVHRHFGQLDGVDLGIEGGILYGLLVRRADVNGLFPANIPNRLMGFSQIYRSPGPNLGHDVFQLVDCMNQGATHHECQAASGGRSGGGCPVGIPGNQAHHVQRQVHVFGRQLGQHGIRAFTRVGSSRINGNATVIIQFQGGNSAVSRTADTECSRSQTHTSTNGSVLGTGRFPETPFVMRANRIT